MHCTLVAPLIFVLCLLVCACGLAAEVVTVDLARDLGPVTYRASGFLHGMTAEVPSPEWVAPLKPRLFRDWADEPNGAFAIYDRVRALGARSQIVIADSYGYRKEGPWPGDGGDWSRWERTVADLVTRAQKQGRTFEWDIWNEPADGFFWRRSRDQFFETWRRGVTTLRRLDPKAVVVGPSLGAYDSQWMEAFLVYAKEHQVLPDVLCWHELDDGGPSFATLPAHVADARLLLNKHGIRIDRIQMNEIIGPDMQLRPGAAIRFFAVLERAEIEGACHACWDDEQAKGANCDNCSLDGLLTHPDQRPRATWWAYKAYADITGRLVAVQPSKSVDAVAGRDAQTKEIRIAVGRVAGGQETVELHVTHLGAAGLAVGGEVHILAERIPKSGWEALPAPLPVLDVRRPVSGDAVVVQLPDFGPDDAYAVTLSPAGNTRPAHGRGPA